MDSNEVFSSSYQRCCIDQEFLTYFLQHFCRTNPRFSERFGGVDIDQQTKMLKASIILIHNASENAYVRNNVKNLAIQHKNLGLNIKGEELVAWRESLLVTVKAFDPHYNDDIDDAWRSALKVGMELMKEHATYS
ncbi:globin [Vibrio comitans]|uniref:Globin family profile domain-containing protein n=1 Tax=Vibrio comitans NBRC 102076 TaxID=1219078 RepID=A0A4Y3IMZ7_9VIBR|nr:globin [Vibrio comitans]GEA60863.1 hypothetical protein VCO01S_20560 [Vibrio comitans NBRC 102076]